jgi:hypothetical protein
MIPRMQGLLLKNAVLLEDVQIEREAYLKRVA